MSQMPLSSQLTIVQNPLPHQAQPPRPVETLPLQSFLAVSGEIGAAAEKPELNIIPATISTINTTDLRISFSLRWEANKAPTLTINKIRDGKRAGIHDT